MWELSLIMEAIVVNSALSRYIFSLFHPLSVRDWTSTFLLAAHRLCGAIEEWMSHFQTIRLRAGWQTVISLGNIPWYTPPRPGIKPRSWREQTLTYIHSLTELSWPTKLHICTLKAYQFCTITLHPFLQGYCASLGRLIYTARSV